MSTVEPFQPPAAARLSDSPEETMAFAAELAAAAKPGDVFALSGPLGAGKTTFSQGFAAALGVAGPVCSPTFNLVREYRTASGLRLAHMDFHRLAGAGDAPALGVDELLGAPDTICLVEWPERAWEALPPWTILVRMAFGDAPGERRAEAGPLPSAPPEASEI